MMKLYYYTFLLLFSAVTFGQKFQNLASTPPMGWNSWNTFQTNINEKLVKDMADLMVSSGMKDHGYTYLVLDDGWMAMERDSLTGDLVADPKKFPNGMKVVSDYVHAKGLKFGLYNCAGTKTCAGYPGTRGYEYQDARLYAALEIDYLKFDWCNTEGINAREAYATMSKAIRKAARPIVFSLCEWGQNKPWEWAENIGQLWRTTGDISSQFDSLHNYGTWSALGAMKILDLQVALRKFAGPGHWNDPDMLEVGNGMSFSEDKAHFSMWCMLAAPLMAGNDFRKMSAQTKLVLNNQDAINVDQDRLGIEGFKYATRDSIEIWAKPLSENGWALCFLNRTSTPKSLKWKWQKELIYDSLSARTLEASVHDYSIKDVWTAKQVGNSKKPVNIMVGPHDVWMVVLKEVVNK
ncbi:MAG: hypothetical protein NVS1B13_13160 [Flavisolibacter sp.]